VHSFIRLVLGAVLLATAALAQNYYVNTHGQQAPVDAFQVRYVANLTAGDSIVNLTNAASEGGLDPSGDICANVYVFADDQQLVACCACALTPNHLQYLSVKSDLVSNTLTPGIQADVTIALVATKEQSGTCNPSQLNGVQNEDGQGFDVAFASGLRAWATTLHAVPGGNYGVTETKFSQAYLSDSELDKMVGFCDLIQADGSGYGICGSCTQGAAGANKAQ
jgi:hypothetical protein